MDAMDPPPGLRERKKVKTRATIRREALRLFEEKGYANTTIEQIANAADISSSTFFRYFPAKEAVLLSNDLIEPIIDAFIDAPAELSPIAAYRHGVATTFGALTAAEQAELITGERLMYAVPEARGLLYAEYMRLIELIADGLAVRLGRPTDAFERRMTAGAIVGVLMAASDGTPMPDDPISRGLSFLEATMPLS
jgi:AcrR family transcriptional regulator